MKIDIRFHVAPGDGASERGRELAQTLLGAASASKAEKDRSTFETALSEALSESVRELMVRQDGTMMASLVFHLVRIARILLEGWSDELAKAEGLDPASVETRALQVLAIALEREAVERAEEFQALRGLDFQEGPEG